MYMVIIKLIITIITIILFNTYSIHQVSANECSTKIEGSTLPNSGDIIKHQCDISAYYAFIENHAYANQIERCLSNYKNSEFILNDCNKPFSTNKRFFEFKRAENCSTELLESYSIYDNCILDKSEGKGKYLRRTIERVCKRISCNPSFLESFKYK